MHSLQHLIPPGGEQRQAKRKEDRQKPGSREAGEREAATRGEEAGSGLERDARAWYK